MPYPRRVKIPLSRDYLEILLDMIDNVIFSDQEVGYFESEEEKKHVLAIKKSLEKGLEWLEKDGG